MFWNRANPGLGPGKSWIFFVYALFLAIDFVKNKIKNIYKICNKASAENS